MQKNHPNRKKNAIKRTIIKQSRKIDYSRSKQETVVTVQGQNQLLPNQTIHYSKRWEVAVHGAYIAEDMTAVMSSDRMHTVTFPYCRTAHPHTVVIDLKNSTASSPLALQLTIIKVINFHEDDQLYFI